MCRAVKETAADAQLIQTALPWVAILQRGYSPPAKQRFSIMLTSAAPNLADALLLAASEFLAILDV